jgi:hypothetical protein
VIYTNFSLTPNPNLLWGSLILDITSTQVFHLDTGFLGSPVSLSKCWIGSQDSMLPLQASHVALPT